MAGGLRVVTTLLRQGNEGPGAWAKPTWQSPAAPGKHLPQRYALTRTSATGNIPVAFLYPTGLEGNRGERKAVFAATKRENRLVLFWGLKVQLGKGCQSISCSSLKERQGDIRMAW